MAERPRGRRSACRRTSTPRATRAGATTAAARSSTRSSTLAIDRAKELFGAEHANVQPHAGAQTNMAVYSAVLEPGDTILSLRLDHGGHLTHGLKVNFSGRLYTIVHYGVSRETNVVDYDEVLAPREGAPAEADRLRRLGVPAHRRGRPLPRDRRRGRRLPPLRHGPLRGPRRGRAAPEPGAALRLRHLDDAQDARRPARRLHPLPRGARAGGRPRGLPGDAGRAARCTRSPPRRRASGSPATEAFRDYQAQVRANADALAESCQTGGLDVLTGGTDTHLLQLDLRALRVDGQGRARSGSHEVKHDGEPEHRAVRRAAADGRLRACGIGTPARDDARLRRGRLPRGRARSSSPRSPTTRTSPPCAARSRGALRASGRSTRASAASRPTRDDAEAQPATAQSLVTEVGHHRSSSTSSRTCATRTADRPLPPARQRDDAAPHLRGDEGLPDRGGRGRDAARADGRRSGSPARRSPSARCCARASACSTASSR